jgi:hypothetical protein
MGKYNKIFSRIMLKSLKICTSIVTIASCNNNIISNENFNSEKLKDIWEDIENIQQEWSQIERILYLIRSVFS